jgi:hypothetical protein
VLAVQDAVNRLPDFGPAAAIEAGQLKFDDSLELAAPRGYWVSRL